MLLEHDVLGQSTRATIFAILANMSRLMATDHESSLCYVCIIHNCVGSGMSSRISVGLKRQPAMF